jgi:hypothetical protein
MSTANIKLPTELISKLKASTGEVTGQKAIEAAINEYLKFKRKLSLVNNLSKISFKESFDPLKLRKHER